MTKVTFRNGEGSVKEADLLSMSHEDIVSWFTQTTGYSEDQMKKIILKEFQFRVSAQGYSPKDVISKETCELMQWLDEEVYVSKNELVNLLVSKITSKAQSTKKKEMGKEEALSLLGLDSSADEREIEKKFASIIIDIHPQLNPEADEDEDKLRQYKKAYKVITGNDPTEAVTRIIKDEKTSKWIEILRVNVANSRRATDMEKKLSDDGIEYEKKVIALSPTARDVAIYVKPEDKNKALSITESNKKKSFLSGLLDMFSGKK